MLDRCPPARGGLAGGKQRLFPDPVGWGGWGRHQP